MIEPTHASATHRSDKKKIYNLFNAPVANKQRGIMNKDLPLSDKKCPPE